MTPELLKAVKSYPGIDITWEDLETDEQITNLIRIGMSFLNKKAGAVLDFEKDETPRQLLMEYCKYSRNGNLHEYMANLAPFLVDLRSGDYADI